MVAAVERKDYRGGDVKVIMNAIDEKAVHDTMKILQNAIRRKSNPVQASDVVAAFSEWTRAFRALSGQRILQLQTAPLGDYSAKDKFADWCADFIGAGVRPIQYYGNDITTRIARLLALDMERTLSLVPVVILIGGVFKLSFEVGSDGVVTVTNRSGNTLSDYTIPQPAQSQPQQPSPIGQPVSQPAPSPTRSRAAHE